jgi:hypothetical protein
VRPDFNEDRDALGFGPTLIEIEIRVIEKVRRE